jgi:hypothetical protein
VWDRQAVSARVTLLCLRMCFQSWTEVRSMSERFCGFCLPQGNRSVSPTNTHVSHVPCLWCETQLRGNKRRTTCSCSGWIELCSLCPRGLACRNLRNRNLISCYSVRCPEICIGYFMYRVQFKFILSGRRLHLLQAGSNQRESTWNLSTEGRSFGLGVVVMEAGR